MEFYFAPMEGITGHVYRRAHHKFFAGIDKYFIPFISPNQFGHLSSKEKNNLLPENNQGMRAVPQILTNSSEDFIKTAKKLCEYGYTEVNLNLGCPSRTVVTKGRGSGFLAFPDKLERFLDEIFEAADMAISIKTRIGRDSPKEFERLLQIYAKFPVSELIIHPRLQTDFYKNTPDWEVFGNAYLNRPCQVCYNGDIFTAREYERFSHAFPETEQVMLGRGLLTDPGLVERITAHKALDKPTLLAFHNQIYGEYQDILFGEKTILFKMKELWSYMTSIFSDYAPYAKRIKKAEKLASYERAVKDLFEEQEILTAAL